MQNNTYIASKFRLSSNLAAPVRSRLFAVETACGPGLAQQHETATLAPPTETTQFWHTLSEICAQNISAIENTATGGATGAIGAGGAGQHAG